MKMIHVLVTACVAGLLSMPAGAAPTENPQKADSSHQNHQWADLGLNQNQKDQMKALHKENQETMKADFEASKTLNQKIKDEFLKPNPDPGVLETYTDQLAQLQKQMLKNRIADLFKTKQILTPDQFKKFLDMQYQWGRGDHFKKGHNEDHEQG
jgi:Spy/CpxP family protein refolding chaperone